MLGVLSYRIELFYYDFFPYEGILRGWLDAYANYYSYLINVSK